MVGEMVQYYLNQTVKIKDVYCNPLGHTPKNPVKRNNRNPKGKFKIKFF